MLKTMFNPDLSGKRLTINDLRLTIYMAFLIGMLALSTNAYAQKSGEFLIDTSIDWVNAPYDQRYASVSFDGVNYLAVWTDSRGADRDIYGARVSQSGEVLDEAGIAISIADGNQWYPSVSFDGTNYFVVWQDERNFGCTNNDIYGARVSQSGQVLDPEGIAISTGVNAQSWPAVAFDGTNYLVVWEERIGFYYDIYGVQVSQSGEVLDTAIVISDATQDQWYPAIGFDGTNCLVVWQDYRNSTYYADKIGDRRPGEQETRRNETRDRRQEIEDRWHDYRNSIYYADIYGARVNQSGELLDTAGIAISIAEHNQWYPAVGFDGTNYFVAWTDSRGSNRDIYGTGVSQSGEVLDTVGIAISTAESDQWCSAVGFDGTNYFVVWQDERSDDNDIYGARVNQSGEVLDTAGIAVSTAARDQWYPAIGFGGENYLTIWADNRTGIDDDIYGARVSQSGEVLDTTGILISFAANMQVNSAAYFGGVNYLVVWENESDNLDYEIHGMRVNQSGVSLDPASIVISEGYNPAISFDGTNWLVVRDGVWGARVNQSGEVLDTPSIYISGGNNPAVAFDGTNYLVMGKGGWYGHGICGARVNQSGEVLDQDGIVIIDDYETFCDLPSVSFGDTNYLVVWQDQRYGSYDIYGTRVSPSGGVLDPHPSYSIYISVSNGPQLQPSVAFDGTNWLVVWEDKRSGVDYDIYGARVSQSGEVLGQCIAIATADGDQLQPSVCFDGTNFLVAWEDEYRGDIYGALVSPSGVVIDSFEISTQPGRQHSPDLTRGPGEQVLITWTGWTPTINNQPANTYRIWGKLYPFLVGIDEELVIGTEAFKLYQNYPNPFGASTTISFSATDFHRLSPLDSEHLTGQAQIRIYNLKGQLVKQLSIFNSQLNWEQSSIKWNGKDENGRELSNGIYFYQLQTGDYVETKKMVILR